MKENVCFIYKGILCFALCVMLVVMLMFMFEIVSMAMVELAATGLCFVILLGILTGFIASIM